MAYSRAYVVLSLFSLASEEDLGLDSTECFPCHCLTGCGYSVAFLDADSQMFFEEKQNPPVVKRKEACIGVLMVTGDFGAGEVVGRRAGNESQYLGCDGLQGKDYFLF